MGFVKAIRSKTKLRMALDGPSGSGKTFTGLRFAFAVAGESGRVGVICSENGSAAKYQGEAPDGTPWNFDILVLKNYAPTSYTDAILEAGRAGFDVLLVDSLSHAWSGSGGALEIKDSKGGNSYTAWKDVTPMHNKMIEAILTSSVHIIATMRSKTEYVLESDEKGRSVPKKVGMAPVQRAGMEYEFDVYGSLDLDHTLRITKSRCRAIDAAISVRPESSFMRPVIDWLNSGEPTAAGPSLRDQMIARVTAAGDAAGLNVAMEFAKSVQKEMSAGDWKEIESAARRVRGRIQAAAGIVTSQPAPASQPAAATPAPSANGTQPAAPVTDQLPPVRVDQLEQLKQLRPHYYVNENITDEAAQQAAWAKLLKPYGVNSALKLTAADADQIIAKVKEKIPFG